MLKKSEIATTIAEMNGITKKLAGEVIDNYCAMITNHIATGGEVVIPGVGKLKTKLSPPRGSRNPKTGEAIQVPEKTKVVFRAANTLKAELNR